MGKTQGVGTTDTGTAPGDGTTPGGQTTEERSQGSAPATGVVAQGEQTGKAQAPDPAAAAPDPAAAAPDPAAAAPDPAAAADEMQSLTADRDKWRAMARKNEDRAKANVAAAQALKDVEAERDTLKTQNEAHTARVGDLEAENSRLLAALKHGLADSDLRFLKGVPADEIDAAAADLAARVGRTSGGRERFLGRETPPGSGPGAGGDFLRQAMTARHI